MTTAAQTVLLLAGCLLLGVLVAEVSRWLDADRPEPEPWTPHARPMTADELRQLDVEWTNEWSALITPFDSQDDIDLRHAVNEIAAISESEMRVLDGNR